MKNLIILMAVLTLSVACFADSTELYWDDGVSHTISDTSYVNTFVHLDYNTENSPGTHAEIVDGSEVALVRAYNNSTVNMSGGNNDSLTGFGNSVITKTGGLSECNFTGNDNATLTMSGGEVYNIYSRNNSNVTMSGGIAYTKMASYDNSNLTMSGGRTSNVWAWNDSKVHITGDSRVWDIVAVDNSEVTVSGGTATRTSLSDNSCLIFTGGELIDPIKAYNSSQVTMSGGQTHSVVAYDGSTVNMSGGIIKYGLHATEDSICTLSGGIIGQINPTIAASDNAMLYLVGTDFMVDGEELKAGDKLSDYGVSVRNGYYYHLEGTITGTLADGSPLDTKFYVKFTDHPGTGDIIIVPEPASMLLLGLGAITLRKRK